MLINVILISRELNHDFFFKFVELSIKRIPANVKIDCGTKTFGKTFVLQFFPVSCPDRGPNVTLYVFFKQLSLLCESFFRVVQRNT